MTIVPETKDWTWVLHQACPECGFDVPAADHADLPARIRSVTETWAAVLRGTPGYLHTRPSPTMWSPLEYSCHVRDVLRLFDQRLQLILTEDDPQFMNWDQDATAIADRYGEQDPARVSRELIDASTTIADRYASLSPDQWHRPGRRSDGAVFTVESFSRYFLHDITHHVMDVEPIGT